MRSITIEESRAFIEVFTIQPTATGPLDGLTFAIKDLMDVAGKVTGCGNPTWKEMHLPAAAHAVCVEQLLAAGATAIGKTITDEVAFSLLGENHHYGTPLNPKAPDRVPGGSSCGSASAVACSLADFSLGTDTGGSVRVPAANCGIYGLRPTHDRISVAGVNPLSPTFDTVGVFARDLAILTRVNAVLTGIETPQFQTPHRIYLLQEAFDLCDPEVKTVLLELVQRLEKPGFEKKQISMREIDRDSSAQHIENWKDIYSALLWAEAESCLGSWVSAAQPNFGPMIQQSFQKVREFDRKTVGEVIRRRERYFTCMDRFLGPTDVLCIPTTPSPAPLKGSIRTREQAGSGYYPRTLSLTAIAGVARLPQVNIPAAHIAGAPIGISLLARSGEDAFLLAIAQAFQSIA